MNSSSTPTGERVQRLRKLRGMTQADLARTSGLGLHTVKDVEGGIGNPRNRTLRRVADALRVDTSAFLTPGEPEFQPVPGEPWEEVRDALYRRTEGPAGEPLTPQAVLAELAGMRPDWENARYGRVRLALPDLITDALALAPDQDGRGARAAALAAAASVLTMTRQFEDATAAARLAMDAAPDLGGHLAAVQMLVWGLLRQGRPAEAGALAARWADEAEPRFSRATDTELAGYGRMLLFVANAMVTDNQPGAAADALALARAAAARIGREVPFHPGSTVRFGPATVAVITAETAVLSWKPDEALMIAERVAGTLGPIEPAQRCRHRLDVASAHAMRQRWTEATEVLLSLADAAPEWLPCQQYARDILETIIAGRRGPATPELRQLAAATRLPL
jgi:transcriptional regulator with XRE-family HTH domain